MKIYLANKKNPDPHKNNWIWLPSEDLFGIGKIFTVTNSTDDGSFQVLEYFPGPKDEPKTIIAICRKMPVTGTFSVGDTFWVQAPSYRVDEQKELKEMTVSKIGSKYFYFKELEGRKFDKTTLKDAGDLNYKYKVYLSQQEYAEETERNLLFSEITKFFRNMNHNVTPSKLSLSWLRDVYSKILNR